MEANVHHDGVLFPYGDPLAPLDGTGEPCDGRCRKDLRQDAGAISVCDVQAAFAIRVRQLPDDGGYPEQRYEVEQRQGDSEREHAGSACHSAGCRDPEAGGGGQAAHHGLMCRPAVATPDA